MTFHHGATTNEISSGPVFVREVGTSTIGMIAFADDADAGFFPLDKPVLLTNLTSGIAKAGYEGNLRRSLETIQAVINTKVIVIRVATPIQESNDIDNAKVIGSTLPSGDRTGLQALLTTQALFGEEANIIIAPDVETAEVVQAMIGVAVKLDAMCYVNPRTAQGDVLDKEAIVTYRNTLSNREVILLENEWEGHVLLGKLAEVEVEIAPVG